MFMKRIKKYFKSAGSFIIIFFITTITYAQIIPTIPYAQIQPKWFFPLIIQDATGARDTIYFGFDPNTGPWHENEELGEIKFSVDSDTFFLATEEYYSPIPPNDIDSVNKARILDSASFVTYPLDIKIFKAVFPVKIWWDDITRLRSDSLPFPDPPSGAPRGQIIIDIGSCNCLFTNPGKNAWGGYIIISDSAQIGFDSQTVQDTLFFADPVNDPNPRYLGLYAYFTKWTGTDFGGISEIKQGQIKIFPNPVNDFLVVEEKMLNESYWIYDLSGKEIISGKLINNKISVVFLSKGMYFLKISSNQYLQSQKFIKQ